MKLKEMGRFVYFYGQLCKRMIGVWSNNSELVVEENLARHVFSISFGHSYVTFLPWGYQTSATCL
jgi:hypothetical protein